MDKRDLLLEKWKLASELHRHEDTLVWARFSNFLTIMGILFSGLGLVQISILPTLNANVKTISILISVWGILISIIFSFIFLSSKRYQRYRIEQAKEAEYALKIGDEQILDIYKLELKKQILVPLRFQIFSTYDLILTFTVVTTLIWIICISYVCIN